MLPRIGSGGRRHGSSKLLPLPFALILVAGTLWIGATPASAVSAAQVSAGNLHTCAVTTAGGVKCWGAGGTGQLGNGDTSDSSVPVDVTGLGSGVAQISAGGFHTCVVTTSGGAKCWGNGFSGELGTGVNSDQPIPVDVFGLTSGVAQISAGRNHTCAVTTSGGAKCWGAGGQGRLGNGDTAQQLTPVDVTGLTTGVAQISAGVDHTCAVTTAGGAKCWGAGLLGNDDTAQQNSPVDVTGLTTGVAQISSGNAHTCAVTTAGGAKCWGVNHYGQLGNDDTAQQLTPVDVTGLTTGVAQISAGGFHSCAVTTSGGATCWGFGADGQLGNDDTGGQTTPVDVTGLTTGVAQISAGFDHTCAVTTSGEATCWGAGADGRLGNGDTSDSSVPVDVIGFTIRTLSVVMTGSGNGTITSDPAGIDCFPVCSATFEDGSEVVLTFTPSPNTTFEGWTSGGCTGTGTCTVTMDASKTVTAHLSSVDPPEPVATKLSIKAPNKAAKGKKITVTGKLTSSVKACTQQQKVTLSYGGKKKNAKTKNNGTYTLAFKVKKTDPAKKVSVQVKFAKNGICKASASKKRTVKLV